MASIARRPLEIAPWDPNLPNEELIAGLREELGNDFERRVPDPTKAGMEATMRALNNYRPNYNQFVDALINKVGRTIARNSSWSNPFARFKLGMLEYGESIEEYNVGLIQAYSHDPKRAYGERALFGRHGIDAQSAYHVVNRQDMYAITVEHPVLKRAFLTPDGLAQFVTNLMDAPSKSDNWDEFLIMCSLFSKYERMGGFFKVHVDDVSSTLSDDVIKSHSLRNLRTLREYADMLPFLSVHYNAAKMPVSANPEDLILFVTPEFKAALDVNALASLFNVERGEIPYRVITIPKERFNIPGAQAILTTEDFFVVADTYFDTASQPNPAGRYENWFLHHDGIYSASRFVPAILFTTGEGDVIEFTETPVTGVSDITITNEEGTAVSNVERGGHYVVSAEATTEGENDAVRLLVTGNESQRTTLEQQGTFSVALDESADSLKLIAISTDDPDFRKERTVTVTGDIASFWPNPGMAEDDAPAT